MPIILLINRGEYYMANIAKWKLVSQEEFIQIVTESQTIAEIARKLGYALNGKSSGSANASIQAGIKYYNLDASHLKGQHWKKGVYSLDWMHKDTPYRSNYTRVLIQLRGYKCEQCNNTEWLGQPIPLECHHIDGNNTNNESENLLLLCPNCHAQTPTYRNRKIVED